MIREYTTQTWTYGATGHAEEQKIINLSPVGAPVGKAHTFVYDVSNAANAITITFNLYDLHGALHYTKAAIAKNAKTVEKQEYIIMDGGYIGIDPSGDAGVGGITVTVHIYYDDMRG